MSGMDEFVKWLGQQLDTDERIARAAADGDSGEWFMGDNWNVHRIEDQTPFDLEETNALVVYGNVKDQSAHIAEWDPARVLREIEWKRGLVQLLAHAVKGPDHHAMALASFALIQMAKVYVDRPGYAEIVQPLLERPKQPWAPTE